LGTKVPSTLVQAALAKLKAKIALAILAISGSALPQTGERPY
jgi:hypothetical protein